MAYVTTVAASFITTAARTVETVPMKTPRDSESMTPDHRRREIATILAQGVLRYRRMTRLDLPAVAPESSDQQQNSLEVSGESRLHVARAAG